MASANKQANKKAYARDTSVRPLATRLRPLAAENEIAVWVSVELLTRHIGRCAVLEVDIRKALAKTRLAVAADEDTRHAAVVAEQVPEILFFDIFTQIRHTQRRRFVALRRATHTV